MEQETVVNWIPIENWIPQNHVRLDALTVLHKGYIRTAVYWDAMGGFWRYAHGERCDRVLYYVAQRIVYGSMPRLNQFHGQDHESLQVLHSAAGFYLGHLYHDEKLDGYYPYSRDSAQYWDRRKDAEAALLSGDYQFNS